MHADAKNVGAQLDGPDSPVRSLLERVRRLEDLQRILDDWASGPLADAIHIANIRDELVVVFADSAAAYTQLRYVKQELLQHLQAQLGSAALKLEIRMRPAAQRG